MDHTAFVALVRSVRVAQKRYFANRTAQLLNESKDLERRLDRALADLEAEKQPSLFPEKIAGRPESPPPGQGG